VGSLLEVGTGFHPELSGRENIFLNGAILGMKKAEILRKFDEIVAFAEVEKFIDTPVKHYSSGMYVRLAFAVAAHLDPEILVVDEVLSVGDAEFQKKCLGKMGDVARRGRTVVLVSHAMASISSLCSSGIHLDRGLLAYRGPVEEALNRYMGSGKAFANDVEICRDKNRCAGTGELRFTSARIVDELSETRGAFQHGEDVSIEFTLEGSTSYDSYLAVVLIRTLTGTAVLHIPTPPEFRWPSLKSVGSLRVVCRIPECRLYPGTYVVSFWLGRNGRLTVDSAEDTLTFSVEHGPLLRYGFDMSWRNGLYFCDNTWSISQISSRDALPQESRKDQYSAPTHSA
jgi:lipopolysaccharide transport system ATP-binding protein